MKRAALILLLLSPFALAQGVGTIVGCVQKSTGQLRIVGGADVCTASESRVTWSAAGVPGTAGDKGPKGDPGDKGGKGDTGSQGAAGSDGAKGDRGDSLAMGTIIGQAYSCTGALSGAIAYLAGASFVAVSSSDGGFRISHVYPGMYDLVVESNGTSATRSAIVVADGVTTPVGAIVVGQCPP